MPQIPVTNGGPEYDIEPGVYPARILKTETDRLENGQFKNNRDILRIYFRLDDMVTPDLEPVDIDAIASLRLSPSTKLWGWLDSLGFKLDPEEAQSFNTDQLHGMACRVIIIANKKLDGSVWPKVDNVLAPMKAAGAIRPVPGPAYEHTEPERDFTWFWSMVRRAGVTPQQANERMVKPIGQHDDDELMDLVERLKLEYPVPAK